MTVYVFKDGICYLNRYYWVEKQYKIVVPNNIEETEEAYLNYINEMLYKKGEIWVAGEKYILSDGHNEADPHIVWLKVPSSEDEGYVYVYKADKETSGGTGGANTNTPDNPKQDNEEKQDKTVYDILEGKNITWKNGKDKSLVFRSSADFDKFLNVTIDENIVDKEYYTIKSGSTIVEVKEAYLKTLKAGVHKISINSKDGRAEASFKVEQSEENTPKLLPKTGGEINTAILMLFVILVVNMGVTLFLHRKIGG